MARRIVSAVCRQCGEAFDAWAGAKRTICPGCSEGIFAGSNFGGGDDDDDTDDRIFNDMEQRRREDDMGDDDNDDPTMEELLERQPDPRA